MNMSEKRRRGKRRYWTALAVYTALLLAAAAFGLTLVWNYAEEYEASRPSKTMDEYVSRLNESLWDSGISDAISGMKHEAQSDEECAEVVKELLAQGITYARKGGGADSAELTMTYSLRCGGSVIGTVTLMPDDSRKDDVKFDMLPWTVCREDFDFTGLRSSVSVTVPSTYTVKLNGFRLTDKYIVEKDIHFDVLEDYYSINPDLPTKVTYQYDDVIGTLEPVIYDESGNEFTIDESRDDSQFVKPVSAEDSAALEQFGHDFAYNYTQFSSGTIKDLGYALGLVTPYVKGGSDLDKRLREALDGYSWSHTYSLRTDAITFNGATDLGGGYYVVDMTTVATTLDTAHGEQTSTNNMKIITEKSGTKLLAVSIEMY